MARYHRAFTLVELLVVVAIIAIIMSMLLPALRMAREAGMSAACKSNFHQIGLAISVYRMDHRGVYPVYREYQPNVESSTGESAIHQLWGLRHYNRHIDIDWFGDPDTDENVPDVRQGFLAPYIQASNKVLTCPSYSNLIWPPVSNHRIAEVQSYALNLWIGGLDGDWPHSEGQPPNGSHLRRSAEIINYADGTGWRLYLWWPSALNQIFQTWGNGFRGGAYIPVYDGQFHDDPLDMGMQAPYNQHIKEANFLMSDGHVVAGDAANYWYDEFWLNK